MTLLVSVSMGRFFEGGGGICTDNAALSLVMESTTGLFILNNDLFHEKAMLRYRKRADEKRVQNF